MLRTVPIVAAAGDDHSDLVRLQIITQLIARGDHFQQRKIIIVGHEHIENHVGMYVEIPMNKIRLITVQWRL